MDKERLETVVNELEKACVSPKEAEELALLAQNLSNAFKHERSDALKRNFLNNVIPRQQKRYLNVFPLLLAIVLIFLSVAAVEASVPGQPLFPLKSFIHENVNSTDLSGTIDQPPKIPNL